ncbi:unnamed protein product, partial [Musa banksii]
MWLRSSRGRTASSRCTASCGLAPASPSTSAVAVSSTAWNKHRPSGTLESVVNQVTGAAPRSTDLEDWLGGLGSSASVAVDALVPCRDDVAVDGRKRALVAGVCSSQGNAAGSLAGRVDSTTLVTLDTWREDELDLTATTTTTANGYQFRLAGNGEHKLEKKEGAGFGRPRIHQP